MGNILRHSYHRVDDSMVWSTVKEDLPDLRVIVQNLLRGLPAEQRGDNAPEAK